jgi:hypothetical protein
MKCPECGDFERREFLKSVAMATAGLAVTAAVPGVGLAGGAADKARRTTLGCAWNGPTRYLVPRSTKSVATAEGQVAFPLTILAVACGQQLAHYPMIIRTSYAGSAGHVPEIFRNLHNPGCTRSCTTSARMAAGGELPKRYRNPAPEFVPPGGLHGMIDGDWRGAAFGTDFCGTPRRVSTRGRTTREMFTGTRPGGQTKCSGPWTENNGPWHYWEIHARKEPPPLSN